MNRQWEEEQIKKLFQQLKREDERRAPSFARMWETAASRGRAGWIWPVLRVAMATIVSMTLTGVWFVFFRQSAGEQVTHPPAPPETRLPRAPHAGSAPPLTAFSGSKPLKVARRRRASPAPQMDALISQWRSPTDFLLKTPGEQWLREAPRLGAPLVEIKPLAIERKN